MQKKQAADVKNISFPPKEKDGKNQKIVLTDHHLGSGAFGQVKFGYDAEDPKKVYAIKIISRQKIEEN